MKLVTKDGVIYTEMDMDDIRPFIPECCVIRKYCEYLYYSEYDGIGCRCTKVRKLHTIRVPQNDLRCCSRMRVGIS